MRMNFVNYPYLIIMGKINLLLNTRTKTILWLNVKEKINKLCDELPIKSHFIFFNVVF